MREQLTQYVELLFAGAPGSEEIKEEILQNTLDRYDDLIARARFRRPPTGWPLRESEISTKSWDPASRNPNTPKSPGRPSRKPRILPGRKPSGPSPSACTSSA